MYTENKNGYYIDNKGNMVILKSKIDYFLSWRNINTLVLPNYCKRVYCHNNNIEELIIPQGCELLCCQHNNIKELIIPKGCKYLYLSCDITTKLINADHCKYINYFI